MQSAIYILILIAIIVGTVIFMRWFVGFIARKIQNAWIRLLCALVVGGIAAIILCFFIFAICMSLSPVNPN